jgi:hypothetical protein
MQKEIQCVGSGLVLDKLHVENEMNNILQDQFICKSFHGEKSNTNTIGLVETTISGKGIVSDMFYSREPGVVDQNIEAVIVINVSLLVFNHDLLT